jgi:hypothetical protein
LSHQADRRQQSRANSPDQKGVAEDPDSPGAEHPSVEAHEALRQPDIWTVRLPGDLGASTHCIVVRVVDEYGREHNDHLIVEVTES